MYIQGNFARIIGKSMTDRVGRIVCRYSSPFGPSWLLNIDGKEIAVREMDMTPVVGVLMIRDGKTVEAEVQDRVIKKRWVVAEV
jgi:hypothetical protein